MTMAHGHGASLKSYFLVFAALMVLLVATVAVAFLHLGPFSILVAMAIAILKATLIILFFMHVKYRSGLIWLFAAGGFFWFMVLIGLTMMDYATRDPWKRGIDTKGQLIPQELAESPSTHGTEPSP